MASSLYRAMAACVLSLDAVCIAWVIFGAFFTRGRPRLAALHVATLLYGLIVEIFDFWCPLTALETWLEVRGQVSPYHGPFLVHYLDALVYLNECHTPARDADGEIAIRIWTISIDCGTQ